MRRLAAIAMVSLAIMLASPLSPGMTQARAQEQTSRELAQRLRSELALMGYESIEIAGPQIRFERFFLDKKQCPTDQVLSYYRQIDLRNLDMKTVSPVHDVKTEERVFFAFSIDPTPEYRKKALSIVSLEREIRELFPTTGWPFRFDTTIPFIREKFLRKFPQDMRLNRWVARTCFGESPYLYLVFWMSFDDKELLSQFRDTLILYAKSLGED